MFKQNWLVYDGIKSLKNDGIEFEGLQLFDDSKDVYYLFIFW